MAELLTLDSLVSIIWVTLFASMLLYGQRIQLFMMLRSVKGKVQALEHMKNDARAKFMATIATFGANREGIEQATDRLLEYFVISPVNLDPHGIIPKLEHLLDSYDHALKEEVTRLAPAADESRVSTLANLLEVSLGLNTMYRVVRHYYLSGKKMGNIFAVVQLQVALPMIMDAAEAYYSSLAAFAEGLTIGDGLGPLVASKLIGSTPVKELVEDTLVSETELQGRRLLIVRAKGPGGNVGRPGEAIAKLAETYDRIALIITVDGALKLEGESSGGIAEGIGAAIGGPGVERYKIEEVAARKKIPVLAIVVKMSEKEVLTAIKPELKAAAEHVVQKIERALAMNTAPGDTVVVAGIGNTMGIT